jgi:hypothetical protein
VSYVGKLASSIGEQLEPYVFWESGLGGLKRKERCGREVLLVKCLDLGDSLSLSLSLILKIVIEFHHLHLV